MKWRHNHLSISPLFIFFALAAATLLPATAWALDSFFDTAYDPNGNYCNNIGPSYITSAIICQFVTILNNVMTQVFNGIQSAMIPVLQAILTLYLVVFGAQLLAGTTQLNSREILTRLFKVGAVWFFATDEKFSILIAFNFYMGFIIDVGQSIVNSMDASYTKICNVTFKDITSNDTVGRIMPLFEFIDDFIYCAFYGSVSDATTKVMGFFLAMVTLYPPMFGIFLWWALTTANAIAKTVLSFLTTLSAIAFLISLSPIFLSLMLFQITNQFFDNWLRYLTAFSVQIMLVFLVIVMWVIITSKFVFFFNDLSDMIFAFDPSSIVGNEMQKTNSWAICDADFINLRPTCNTPTVYIPPTQVIRHLDLVDYIFRNMVALTAISFAFSQILKQIDEIASNITGAPSLAQYLGGFGVQSAGAASGKKAQNNAGAAKAET